MSTRTSCARALAIALSAALPSCAPGGGAAGGPAAAGPQPYTPAAPIAGAVRASFSLPRGAAPQGFFDLPWPSELARDAKGRPDLRSFPGRDAMIFARYVDAAERDLDGYSIAPVVYFHFSDRLASPDFPADPRATRSARSPVFLVDVDPASPERGAFFPLERRRYDAALSFVPANTLAVKPVAGFALRPGTLYAAVLRRSYGGAAGALGTSLDLEVTKWTRPRADPIEERARALHAATFDYLATLGAERAEIAAIALFRTQIPHAVTARLFEAAAHLPPRHAPRIVSAEWEASPRLGSFRVMRGLYCTPSFQDRIENAPFLAREGGAIALDRAGSPLVVEVPEQSPYRARACGGLMLARFVLTVPAGPMPAAGWPLLVTAHGTTGDAYTFVGEDDFAGWAARHGIAAVSTDQPLHGKGSIGARPGSGEPIEVSFGGIPIALTSGVSVGELAFYNPIRPEAARGNLQQAAVDAAILTRLVATTDFATAARHDGIGPLLSGSADQPAPRFDRDRVMVAGHSQGSQSMIVAGALDPSVRGALLSGCGGDARLGILRRRDLEIMPIFKALLGVAPGELDEFHPMMALVQALADPIDPLSYARFYWDPLPGRAPRPVLHYEGLDDTYTPGVTAEALAIALHATPLAPMPEPVAWLGPATVGLAPLLARGEPARAFAQMRPTRGENGHFVLYREPEGGELAMQFFRAVLRAR